MDLRPYQTGQLDAVASAFAGGLNRLLIKSPTGTGKTVTFARMPQWPGIADVLRLRDQTGGHGAFMLVIAHREELLRQSQDKIQRANPGLMVAIEQGDLHASRYSDVIVASIQTLSAMKYRRLERLLARHTFRLVVVDEAHHSAAASYRTVLARLGFLPMADASDSTDSEAVTFDDVEQMKAALTGWDAQAPKDRLLVGVTATPNRSDAVGLGCVFQSIAYSYALKQAIEDGWLVPIKPWVVETTESLDDVHVSRGDFKQNELAAAVNTRRRNELAVESWALFNPKRAPTIAFTVDVQHAHDLAAAFTARGYRAEAISGQTDKDVRRDVLGAFQKGHVDVITNCMVLTEGTDLPIAGCILHAKPTKSATLYEQMTGRGLRLYPGKTECIVIDLVDVARRHSLQAAPVLYGLPPGVITKGQELNKLAEELEALREKIPNLDDLLETQHFTIEELRDRASTFDVFTIPDLGSLAGVVTMNWIRLGSNTFRVSYPWGDGTETLKVEPDVLGKYGVSLTLRPTPAQGGPYQNSRRFPGQSVPVAPVRQRTLAADIPDVVSALKCAEAFVEQERRSVLKLKDRSAPWRARPASPKQLDYLTKLRIAFNPATLTMGQASDMLDMHSARKGR